MQVKLSVRDRTLTDIEALRVIQPKLDEQVGLQPPLSRSLASERVYRSVQRPAQSGVPEYAPVLDAGRYPGEAGGLAQRLQSRIGTPIWLCQNGVNDAAHLDQLMPNPAIAGKTSDLLRGDRADLVEADFGYHPLEAGALHPAGG